MSEVEWRDIPGFEGRYQVSSCGQVKSLEREVRIRSGKTRPIAERILRPVKAGSGYLAVHLRPAGGPDFKRFYIHRLVATAFFGQGPEGYEVNHKDENKENNAVSNLEWVPKETNLSYGTRNVRCSARSRENSRRVAAIKDGAIVKEYASMHEASLEGFSRFHIKQCCEMKEATHKGYVWAYAEEMEAKE